MSLNADEPRSPWSRPGFVIALALVVVIVIVGVLLAVLPGRQGDGKASPTPSAPTTAAPAAASDSVCGLPAGDQAVPTAAIDAQWALIGRTAVPTSRALGPFIRGDDGWRSCYAHSPAGAVMAAANWIGGPTTADAIRRWAREFLIDSPEKQQTVNAQIAADDDELVAVGADKPAPQVAGFRVLSAAPDRVTLELLVRFPSGSLTALPRTLVWYDGDWRLELPRDFAGLDGTPVSDATGFIAWSGV